MAGISERQNGSSTIVDAQIWTGTGADGRGVAGEELGTIAPWYGLAPRSNAGWLCANRNSRNEEYGLYALSEELLVPAAAPLPHRGAGGGLSDDSPAADLTDDPRLALPEGGLRGPDGAPCAAPPEGSLGLLALGWVGLRLWREARG